jgi:site-specific recombinase XerD
MPPDAPKSHIFFALLDDPIVKNWLDNTISPASRTSKRQDLMGFISWFKIKSTEDIKDIKRSDIIEWRDAMLGPKDDPHYAIRTVKRNMATISKFFELLCDNKVLETNVVLGVERPKLNTTEGATQAINAAQARDLLDAPDPKTIKGKRDRAILATFLFHALRRSELCNLKVKDILERDGIKQLKIHGKGDKERYVPLHPVAIARINDYLNACGHGNNKELAIFRSLSNNGMHSGKGISPIAVYELVIKYGQKVGIDTSHFSPHSLRATAATNTLINGEDIRKVQHWLGHASIQTTAMYDKRDHRPEDSPTFRVRY